MVTALVLVLASALGVAALGLGAVRSPGPIRLVVAVKRYGSLLLIPLPIIALATWAAVDPVAAWLLALSAFALVLTPGGWRAIRSAWIRARIRATWPAVARASGAFNRNDRRGAQWPLDTTVVLNDQVVEYLPRLSWGRATRNVAGRTVGARWRLTAPRGGSIPELGELAEKLAGGLKVAQVEIRYTRPGQGELAVLYRTRKAQL